LKNIIFIILFSSVINISCTNISLPQDYNLSKNNNDQYYLVDNKNNVIIRPSILSIGYNERYIVACREWIEQKRKMHTIVNINTGNVIYTENIQNWNYFIKQIPELAEIKLRNLTYLGSE
jgi:hypothetical protein